MNVIPQAGQVWVENPGHRSVKIFRLSLSRVWFTDGAWTNRAAFSEDFAFSPANSLEWLAVNLCEWNDSFKAVKRAVKQDVKWCNEAVYTSEYTKKQWQECRNKLFGEAKMEVKAEDKPVYTQAMCDNDRQPLAGMAAMVSVSGGEPFECEVRYVGDDHFVFADTCPAEHWYHSMHIKFTPIDTRTEEEKLIDELKGHLSVLRGNNKSNKYCAKTLIREFNITRKDN